MASWYITIDKIDDGEAVGKWNGREETIEEAKKKCTHAFRMLDDDSEVYYHGKSSCNSSFSPLDDFGMPNAGCTEIQYLENGKWETL